MFVITTNSGKYSPQKTVGPGIVLKVMAGDEIDLYCRSYWQGTMGGQTNSSPTIHPAIGALLSALMPVASAGKLGIAQATGTFFDPSILNFLTNNNSTPADKPKAYVNWMFLNEQFQVTPQQRQR